MTETTTEHVDAQAPKDVADERIADLEAKLAAAIGAIDELKSAQTHAAAFDYVDAEPVREKPPIQMSLRELRKYDGPLYIKHNDPLRQFSCHQSLGEHRVDFDLGAAGTADSIGHLPKMALEIRGVQRAIMRGTITVSTDEAMEDEIMLQMGQHVKATEDQMAAIMSPLQPSNTEKDLVTRPCLMCGEYVRDETGAPTMVIRGGQVFQKYADYRSGVAPLCAMHENQSHLWVGSIVEDPETGVRDWQFSSGLVGPAQQGVPVADGQTRATKVRRVGV